MSGMDRERLTLDFFKDRIDAYEVLESLGIDVAYRLGEHIMCHCPDLLGNHKNGDANPSFGFDEEKLLYNCFVCGGGNLLQLTGDMLNLDEEEVEQFLLGMSQLEPASDDRFAEQLAKVMNPFEEVAPDPEYPLNALFPFRKIHPYLLERGISKDVIIENQIGFDESHYGIVIPHIFMGKLKGWQVRHLVYEQDENEKNIYYCPSCAPYHKEDRVPKYKNTPNFPKENSLYGYDSAMRHCRETLESEVIIVESPFTVLYLQSLGFKNVMATFGSFSRAQSTLLFPFSCVLFWPDNDAAGRENTKRAIQELHQFVDLWIVPPVEGEKSDAANLRSANEVTTHLQNAVPAALWETYANTTK